MLPPRPGRRRQLPVMLSPCSAFALVLLLFTSTASAAGAVLGIDFGTSYIKAALVKPGIPLEIVLTKDSKRKEASVVAFKPSTNPGREVGSFPERLYGGDALSLQARFPGDVYPNLKPLLGILKGEAVGAYKERYPVLQVEAVKEMGTVVFKSESFNDQEMPWSVEELLAMEFKNIRTNAEALAGKGTTVSDAVITVPAFYTADERRAIERAAELGGLNSMGLISDGLAVGVNYATSRTFPSVSEGGKPEHHMVFDMGAGSTSATILRFQGRSVKDVGRFNKTVQEVSVVGVGWDRKLGGDALNQVILDEHVRKFVTKPAMKSRGLGEADVKSHGRTMSKLWREAERVRQVLSANSDTRSSFEGLYQDLDFSTKLSRAEFEELAASYAERVDGPLNDALAAAKISVRELDSIILHGGAVRTPFVQKRLERLAGDASKLRSNVNADESAVFGAAFKAAGLSPSFKVKEIRDTDAAGYPAGIMYTEAGSGKDRRQGLFGATGGSAAKVISFKHKTDFVFTFYQTVDGLDRAVSQAQTENLTAGVAELEKSFGCKADDIATTFSVRLSPINTLPEVVGGLLSCEVEGDKKAGSMADGVKDWLGFGKKKDQQPLKDGEDETAEPVEDVDALSSTKSSRNSASGTSASASASTTKVPEKPKKRTETVNIAFTTHPQGLPQPALAEISRMKERLLAFDHSDKGRLQREEALNVLEAFTYRARDLLTESGFEEVSTSAQRDETSKLLSSTSEWLHDQGSGAATEVLNAKLSELKKLVDPVTKRRAEAAGRPEKVSTLKQALDSTKQLRDMVAQQVEMASSASAKAASYEAERSASNAAASADAAEAKITASPDDFADLEEHDTASASQSVSTDVPKYSSPADFSPYTNVDLTEVSDTYESVLAWLEEKEAAQSKLKPYEDPVLSTKELEAKAQELSKVMQDLLYKKMKTPKPSSSKKPKPTKSARKSKKSKKNLATGTETTETPEEVTEPIARPSFVTVGDGDEMLLEEEILRMVRDAKGEGKHDEL